VSDESKFEEFLQRESKGFRMNEQPPADAMWNSIERDVAEAIDPFRRRRGESRRRWLMIGTAIAATLVFGVAMGRWSAGPSASTQQTAAAPRLFVEDSVRITEHARAATVAHLLETEVFLTSVRADLRAQRSDEDLSGRSRELLARTRLLLSARGERSPQVSELLKDLELLLAEIAAVSDSPRAMDVKLLDETMRQGDILPRIRTTLPAPSAGT
jgi:hypothetical protein